MKIFDTHSHYNDERYNSDRTEVLKKIKQSGVTDVVLIGANYLDSISEKELYHKYNGSSEYSKMYYTVGDHPDEIPVFSPDSREGEEYLQKLCNLAKDENLISEASAVGEIGLDYYGDNKNQEIFENQKKWFIAEMNLAKELGLPIVVHSRDACNDTLRIIKKYGNGIGGIIHCFSYEKEIALEYIKMGYYIGIGGTVTFKNARKTKETVSVIPLEKIVTETDCPYLAPTPHRGERNDSSYIKYVIDEISNIKSLDVNKASEILYNNAFQLFN